MGQDMPVKGYIGRANSLPFTYELGTGLALRHLRLLGVFASMIGISLLYIIMA